MSFSRMSNRKSQLPSDDVLYAAANALFLYKENGDLVFQIDPRRPSCKISKVIGKTVGGDDGNGYLMCMLLGLKFKVHQVVWLLNKKEFPKKPIDHINRNKRDNRIENLRLAEDFENSHNLHASTKKTSGTYFNPIRNRYVAVISYKGKKIYIGCYKTQDEANQSYILAKRKLAGEFSPV